MKCGAGIPSINRLIKLSSINDVAGMDGIRLSNDVFLRDSSVVNGYTHSLVGVRGNLTAGSVTGLKCLQKKIQMYSGGQQVWWVDKKEFITLKAELYVKMVIWLEQKEVWSLNNGWKIYSNSYRMVFLPKIR
jgi:hypothetical protein